MAQKQIYAGTSHMLGLFPLQIIAAYVDMPCVLQQRNLQSRIQNNYMQPTSLFRCMHKCSQSSFIIPVLMILLYYDHRALREAVRGAFGGGRVAPVLHEDIQHRREVHRAQARWPHSGYYY